MKTKQSRTAFIALSSALCDTIRPGGVWRRRPAHRGTWCVRWM